MARGKDIIAAVAKGTTWGTAVSVNSANAGFMLTEIAGLPELPDPLLDESLGQNYPQYIDAGNRIVQPVLSGWLRWANTHWNLIAHAIGDDAITGAGPYVHTMDVQVEPDLFSTLCIYDGVTVREIPSFEPTGFSIIGEAGSPFRFEVRGVGDTVLLSGQTNSTLGSVTYRTKEKRIPFGSAQVRINDQSGASLASGDTVYPSSISIVFNRDKGPEFVAQGVAEGSGEWRSRSPEEGGFINCEVQLRFNEYEATTYLLDTTGEDFKKMEISITGSAISGGNYSLVLSFPALRILTPEHTINSPARIGETITMRALMAQSAPNGMSGITNILRAVFTDDVSTAYDA